MLEAILSSAFNLSKNLKISELRNFLTNSFRKLAITTPSVIIYNPFKKDKIIHNYKTSDAYSLIGKILGPDGFINEISDRDVFNLIFGTSNVKQINKVSNWIHEADQYIFRLKPEFCPSEETKVVGFSTGNKSCLSLSCLVDLLSENPAFRVLKVD